MGQYHFPVNLTKKQYLHPHRLGKLMEFISAQDGIPQAMILLLACSNGRGGGDFRGEDPEGLIGSWAGDQIAIVGDSSNRKTCPTTTYRRTGERLSRTSHRRFDNSWWGAGHFMWNGIGVQGEDSQPHWSSTNPHPYKRCDHGWPWNPNPSR